jgi:hypothetical protein
MTTNTVTLHNLTMSQIAFYEELLSQVYGSYIHIKYTSELLATILKHLPEDVEASTLLELTEEYQMIEAFQGEAWFTFTSIAQGMVDGIVLDPISDVSKQAYESMQAEMHANVSRLWGVVSRLVDPALHSTIVEEMLDKVEQSGIALQYYEVLANDQPTLPDNILQIIGGLQAQANKTFVLSPQ